MGNSSSSSRNSHDDSVDFGAFVPQGVYSGPQDWNHVAVAQLIAERKLAPFYRPLEDYEESWDDEQILASRKELPAPQQSDSPTSADFPTTSSTNTLSRPTPRHTRPLQNKETHRVSEATIYKGAVECPICFLYYPPNINHSRCCNHPICTECFVQIKRSEPSPTHLQSDPACCPYCVQDSFGVTYTPPPWRAGLGSENVPRNLRPEAMQQLDKPDTSKRKSFSADSPDVVTTDLIRPDWEAKLAAVKAAVQRRANRRIIMRQVGDRLIPVGVTSGRIHPIGQDLGGTDGSTGTPQGEEGRGTGRRRRGGGNGQQMDLTQFLGMNGQDIEELMVMEAMRLSLAEHEEAQRRQVNQSSNAQNASHSDTGSSTPNAPSTPLSFVLTHRHRAPSPSPASDAAPSESGHSESRSRISTAPSSANVASPLAQAVTNIALGLAVPGSPSAGGGSGTATPAPRPGASSQDQPSSPVHIRVHGAEPIQASETLRPTAEVGADRSEDDGVAPSPEHTPPHQEAAHDSSAIALGGVAAGSGSPNDVVDGQDTNAPTASEGVPTPEVVPEVLLPQKMKSVDSESTSMNVPASYEALPSTPEDSIATQTLLDKPLVSEENTPVSEAAPPHEASSKSIVDSTPS